MRVDSSGIGWDGLGSLRPVLNGSLILVSGYDVFRIVNRIEYFKECSNLFNNVRF